MTPKMIRIMVLSIYPKSDGMMIKRELIQENVKGAHPMIYCPLLWKNGTTMKQKYPITEYAGIVKNDIVVDLLNQKSNP